MKEPTETKSTWPFGYRTLFWLVGSLLAILLVASIFGLNVR